MTHPQQRSRLQKRFFLFLRNLLILSILAVLFGGMCLFIRNYFSVKKISISGDNINTSLRGYESYYQSFLPQLSEKELSKQLINDNPSVQEVTVVKNYPDSLTLKVRTIRPAVTMKVGDEYILLGANGRILSKQKNKPTQLPELFYYQELFREQIKIGELFGFKDLQYAVQFIDSLSMLGYEVKSVEINSFYVIRLELVDSREILVTTEKNIQKQQYQISSILRQFKIDGTNFKRLDVRFDKPVMTK